MINRVNSKIELGSEKPMKQMRVEKERSYDDTNVMQRRAEIKSPFQALLNRSKKAEIKEVVLHA
jgi:DNA-binding protein H-NS